jgi:hypothetical protein
MAAQLLGPAGRQRRGRPGAGGAPPAVAQQPQTQVHAGQHQQHRGRPHAATPLPRLSSRAITANGATNTARKPLNLTSTVSHGALVVPVELRKALFPRRVLTGAVGRSAGKHRRNSRGRPERTEPRVGTGGRDHSAIRPRQGPGLALLGQGPASHLILVVTRSATCPSSAWPPPSGGVAPADGRPGAPGGRVGELPAGRPPR